MNTISKHLTLLAVMIIATAIPASASYVVINGITYEYSGKEAAVKSYVTNIAFPNGKVVIPSQITVADKKYTVTQLGYEAFCGTKITSINIPNTVRVIGARAFCSCTQLTEIIMPKYVMNIGSEVFSGCKALTTIKLSKIAYIGYSAFFGCTSLSGIELPSVVTIGNYAFSGCTSLAHVSIGDANTSIGERAFQNCKAIRSITILASTPPNCGLYALADINKRTCELVVPRESITLYGAAAQWSDFSKMSIYGGVDDITTYDDCIYDMYNIQGVLVRSRCDKSRLGELPRGIYIIKSAQGIRKIRI